MRRLFAVVVLSVLAAATPAVAHQGNPNFRSVITGFSPRAAGVSLSILGGDDRVQLINHANRTVTVFGYNGEPYARILGDGTVQVNKDSPAYYLNADRYLENTHVPAGITGRERAKWTEVSKTGRYDWHDHRIHYMAKGTPPQVKDTKKQTKVFNWQVPLQVGATKGNIDGELFWKPLDNGGPPIGAIAGFIVLLIGGGGAVLYVRQRRDAAGDDDGDAPEAGEAW
jgi:hypothetical protein